MYILFFSFIHEANTVLRFYSNKCLFRCVSSRHTALTIVSAASRERGPILCAWQRSSSDSRSFMMMLRLIIESLLVLWDFTRCHRDDDDRIGDFIYKLRWAICTPGFMKNLAFNRFPFLVKSVSIFIVPSWIDNACSFVVSNCEDPWMSFCVTTNKRL